MGKSLYEASLPPSPREFPKAYGHISPFTASQQPFQPVFPSLVLSFLSAGLILLYKYTLQPYPFKKLSLTSFTLLCSIISGAEDV